MSTNDRVNILMVDDQPAKLLSYEVILSDLGENLLKASSGREALEQLLKADVAVVLMDVSMPDLDGFQLAEMIREHPRFQKTAIIFISAVHLTDVDRVKGYQRGAVDYISVPVVPELLRAKVSVFAELHRKTQQLEKLNRELELRVAQRTEELRNSESQFRTLANSIPQLAWIADPEGNAIWFNERWYQYTGTDWEQMRGDSSKHLIHPDHAKRVLAGVERAWGSGEPWEDTYPLRGHDGDYRWFLSRAIPLRDSNAQIVRWFGTGTDITERKLAENALIRSEKLAAMGRLAGIIAHEINNPLEAISNAFFLLREHPSLDGEARHYAELAEQELIRVSHITKQTLSFYRESQEPVSVSIFEVIDSVLELQSRRLKANGIALDKQFRSSCAIQGYPNELKQVFLNLIANAIEAMKDGGCLRIRVDERTEESTGRRGVKVSVCDTGSGIDAKFAKRVFEPFFTTKETKGTGLGLWISRGIIQKYDGTLRFRSVQISGKHATCFSVFVPGVLTPLNAPFSMSAVAG
jgi:PAS domain S-box-containing protein